MFAKLQDGIPQIIKRMVDGENVVEHCPVKKLMMTLSYNVFSFEEANELHHLCSNNDVKCAASGCPLYFPAGKLTIYQSFLSVIKCK